LVLCATPQNEFEIPSGFYAKKIRVKLIEVLPWASSKPNKGAFLMSNFIPQPGRKNGFSGKKIKDGEADPSGKKTKAPASKKETADEDGGSKKVKAKPTKAKK